MSDRERKRAARRERRQKAAERQAAMTARSEARNQAVRDTLEPLEEGERPPAVSAAAIASGVLTVIFIASGVIAAFDAIDVYGGDPKPAPLFLFGIVLGWMTFGLWRARYWAVLGFMTLLLFLILATGGGLVLVNSIPQALATLFLFAGACALFFFLIRAMARIQMPKPPGT
jgi:peptidoglycan/LPS O-acetylase OafA/YrhL